MIYLAKNEKGVLERIQVVFLESFWGALNINGTKKVVPFSHLNYESVVHSLMDTYPDIHLSRRKVSNRYCQIVRVDGDYDLYDNKGQYLSSFEGDGWVFSDEGEIKKNTSSSEFPDYYCDVEVIHKDKLWVAMDIDTLKWVCLKKDGSEVSTHVVKETCIQDAIRRLS